jgi:hypothetical protein
MKFKPKSEQELQAMLLVEPQECDFEVVSAEDAFSAKGNEMIKLKLRVYTDSGERFIFDYLMEAMAYKLRHFAEATGLIAQYEAGTMTAMDCLNRSGRLKLGIDRDKTGQYADRNGVKDYLPTEAQSRESRHLEAKANAYAPPSPKFEDDEIPF